MNVLEINIIFQSKVRYTLSLVTCVMTHTQVSHHSPCTRSFKKGVVILATLMSNYGTKITLNQKIFCHSSDEVQNIQNQQNLPKCMNKSNVFMNTILKV